MIRPAEISLKAREAGVRDQQIEKDYMLSWILLGIAQHEQLSKTIVFKGGTVLKKIYFKDYRFSEDLDFTQVKSDITNEQIFEWFKEIFEYVLEKANIRLNIIDSNEFTIAKALVDKTNEDARLPEGHDGINFYINYVGPLGGQGSNKKVKVDISRSEKPEFKPVMQAVLIGYSDLTEHQLLCYSLEEVLVEKMRTVMQRMQARDFYDIWYLLEQHGMDVNFYLKEFANKCKAKN
jgi:predicted nucleotidyltransferase component of viral defense system